MARKDCDHLGLLCNAGGLAALPPPHAPGRRASAGACWIVVIAGAVFWAGAAKGGEASGSTGAADAARVDVSTMKGKVLCGYQGWFTAPGDGSGRGWGHYGRGRDFKPGRCTIDLWPDVSDLGADEKYPTAFRHKDGQVAHVFSSFNRKTVGRHFQWMRTYGIDGVFVQRFATRTLTPVGRAHANTVLKHCRDGANAHGRAYAVMYDLSGLGARKIDRVIDDWKSLVDELRITRDKTDRAQLHHGGKPVVAVWGIGFNDGRKYTLAECARLVEFLSQDPKYGRCTVVVGVPSWWRTLQRDSVRDRALHEVILKADVVCPWTVGRYATDRAVERHGQTVWGPDMQWCKARGKEYLPVVFPGFSWHNLKGDSPLDQIPRRGGRFLWKQFVEAKRAGATMIYQAMFDEIDEGTAIFKCTNDPPVGANRFLTYEGLPSDHYLWLVGQGGRLLRGRIEPTDAPPRRPAIGQKARQE